jgi:murein DD-endopeptidase MepM/ murein hydrolase activator NlpD
MILSRSTRLLLFFSSASFETALAQPVLEVPVACAIPSACSVQKHVDHAPGPERLDFACGTLTTDDHNGTDFRVNDASTLWDGIPVLAAADGEVLRVRDGEPDISVHERGRDPVEGREAGNGIVIAHGGGWTTQYSHLAEGSLKVRPGDRVTAGEKIATIGLSGLTEYPHLHFTLRQGTETVDPFSAEGAASCGQSAKALWSPAASQALAYRPSGVLDAGFAASAREAKSAPSSLTPEPIIRTRPDALILWGLSFGTRPGDIQRFEIAGPDGSIVHRREEEVKRGFLEARTFSGFRFKDEYQPGDYHGRYTLLRDGEVIGSIEKRSTVRDAP